MTHNDLQSWEYPKNPNQLAWEHLLEERLNKLEELYQENQNYPLTGLYSKTDGERSAEEIAKELESNLSILRINAVFRRLDVAAKKGPITTQAYAALVQNIGTKVPELFVTKNFSKQPLYFSKFPTPSISGLAGN